MKSAEGYQRILVSPDWPALRRFDGPHLIFGKNPLNPPDWEEVDLPFNLLQFDNWFWKEVQVIHCVSMLYQWDYSSVLPFLKKCREVLVPGGTLWLGEATRDVDQEFGIFSLYTAKSLERIVETMGFSCNEQPNSQRVTGRPEGTMFALECVKTR